MALIAYESEVNAIILVFTTRLDLKSRSTNIEAQKINISPLETRSMTFAKFLVLNIQKLVWFLEKTFLLINTSIKVILKISFLFLNNIDIKFEKPEKLIWRFYIIMRFYLLPV